MIMKSRITILLTVILSACALTFGQSASPAKPVSTVKLPTTQEVLDKYIAAVGGRDAVMKVKSWKSTGTVELVPMGVSGSVESVSAAPDRSYSKTTLAGLGEFVEGFDGKTAWSSNPIQGMREKTGTELAQTRLLNNFYRELNLDKAYSKLTVKGTEKVGDKDAYVVTGQAEGLPETTFYFDTKTGLLIRTDATLVSPEGQQPAKIYLDEMKAFDGVLMPTKVRTVIPTMEIRLTVTDYKSNVPVDEAIFVRPKS